MSYIINDLYYDRIIQKIEKGIYKKGNICILNKRNITINDIKYFSLEQRTPEVCSSLMDYGKCRFADVPDSSRTREFFINSFTNPDVYDYIRSHIADFDKQFFKDLIETNNYATSSSNNCFSIMPTEYIDEEMCSLAIINSLDWNDDAWFYCAFERNKEAITSDLWKLGARLYTGDFNRDNKFLDITPDRYKDDEYFMEMCSCNFNANSKLIGSKSKIMDKIPQEVVTQEFLVNLLSADIDNISSFNEKALETEVTYVVNGKTFSEKIWKFAIIIKGDTIRNIKLNDERIEFFLNHYDKDSNEYIWSFKDKYRKYKNKNHNVIPKIDQNTLVLPIKFNGSIPEEFSKKLDSEEYLEMMYKKLGIRIIGEYDELFYCVDMPNGWSTDSCGNCTFVKDSNGEPLIEYAYFGKCYDRDAYVKTIHQRHNRNN